MIFHTSISLLWHHLTARHTRGYSIHSPFLFEIANSILTDPHSYYCFAQIEQSSSNTRARRANKEVRDAKRNQLTPSRNQMLYKLATYLRARRIIEVGTCCGNTTRYMQATHSQTSVHTYPDQPVSQAWDMAILHADLTAQQVRTASDLLLGCAHDRSVLVVDGIRHSQDRWQTWLALCTADRVTASMDLGTMGLIYCDPYLPRQTYRIRIK